MLAHYLARGILNIINMMNRHYMHIIFHYYYYVTRLAALNTEHCAVIVVMDLDSCNRATSPSEMYYT